MRGLAAPCASEELAPLYRCWTARSTPPQQTTVGRREYNRFKPPIKAIRDAGVLVLPSPITTAGNRTLSASYGSRAPALLGGRKHRAPISLHLSLEGKWDSAIPSPLPGSQGGVASTPRCGVLREFNSLPSLSVALWESPLVQYRDLWKNIWSYTQVFPGLCQNTASQHKNLKGHFMGIHKEPWASPKYSFTNRSHASGCHRRNLYCGWYVQPPWMSTQHLSPVQH